jgi:hypothetical protein
MLPPPPSFGSRGANGVIVITTKKAATPAKQRFAWSSEQASATTSGTMKTDGQPDERQPVPAPSWSTYNLTSCTATTPELRSMPSKQIAQQQTFTAELTACGLSGGNDNGKFRASFLASIPLEGIIKTTGLDKIPRHPRRHLQILSTSA